jgi:hypothetical protein
MPDGYPSARSIFAGDSPKPSPTLSTVSCDPDCTEQLLLEEMAHLSSDADKSRHERYLSVFQLLQRRDSGMVLYADFHAACWVDACMDPQKCATLFDLCGSNRVRNPSRSKTTERDSNSASFIPTSTYGFRQREVCYEEGSSRGAF